MVILVVYTKYRCVCNDDIFILENQVVTLTRRIKQILALRPVVTILTDPPERTWSRVNKIPNP